MEREYVRMRDDGRERTSGACVDQEKKMDGGQDEKKAVSLQGNEKTADSRCDADDSALSCRTDAAVYRERACKGCRIR